MQNSEKKTNNCQQLQELRGKIYLSDGQRKGMFEELEKTRKNNEAKIKQLLEDVWILQQSKLKDRRMCETVYWKISNDKQLARICGKKSPEKVREELEQKVFMLRKERDKLRCIRKRKTQRLRMSAKDGVRDYKLGVKEITFTEEAKMKYFETCIAQLQIKIDEANYIKQLYKNIITTLQEEEQMFSQRLKKMEDDLLKYIAETKRIHQVENLAKKLRDDIICDITVFEWKLRTSKSEHERNSKDVQTQIDEEKEEIKTVSKRKSIPYSIKMWEDLMNQIKDPSKIASEEKQLASFIELFDEVRNKTGIATAEDLVELHNSQKSTCKFLKEKEENLLAQLANLQQEKNGLENRLEELKFIENQKYFKTFELIRQQNEKMCANEKLINSEKRFLEDVMNTNANIKAILEEIFSKFDGIKGYNGINIPDTVLHNLKDDYLQQLIEACAAKILALQKNYEEQEADIILITPNPISPKEPSKLIENSKEAFVSDELELNLDGIYTKFLTRNLIKQMSKQMIECQAKLKKRMLYMPEAKSTQRKKQSTFFMKKS